MRYHLDPGHYGPLLISSYNPFSMSGSGVSTMYGGPSPWPLPTTSSTVVFVWLWLALGSLWFGVGCAGWVGLLNRHGPAQVGALTQEVGLRRETKRTFSQDHSNRRRFLGSGSVPKLERGEVCCISLAQELHTHIETVRISNTQRGKKIKSKLGENQSSLSGKTREEPWNATKEDILDTNKRIQVPGIDSGTSLKVCQQYISVRGWGLACCKQRCPSWSHTKSWS